MSVDASSIVSPKIAIEFVAVAAQSLGLTGLFAVSCLKLKDHLKTPSPSRLTASIIGFFYFTAQLIVTLTAYPLKQPVAFSIQNFILYPTTLSYALFQINVLSQVAGLSMGKWKNIVVYGLTALTFLMFVSCATPKLLSYSAYNPTTDTGFWTRWAAFGLAWNIYVVVLDVVLNLVLLSVLFSSVLFKVDPSHAKAGGHTKNLFIGLCVLVLVFDVAAVVFSLKSNSPISGDENLLRTARAFGLLVGACTCIHVATGLYYLTALVSTQRANRTGTKLSATVSKSATQGTAARSSVSEQQ